MERSTEFVSELKLYLLRIIRAGIESDANNGIYKVVEYKRGKKFGRSTKYDGNLI